MESINYKKIFTQKVQHQEFIHKLDEFWTIVNKVDRKNRKIK